MANEHNSASLPVESDSIQAELQAAFARIADVPAGPTLIDDLTIEQWSAEITDNISAGSSEHDQDELDDIDIEHKEIA